MRPHVSFRTPTIGVMKFTMLVDRSWVIITMHSVCLNHVPENRRIFSKKYCNFTRWLVWPRPSKEPLVITLTIFIDPSLIIIIYSYFVCSMPGRIEEDFKRNNVCSRYTLYGHALAQEPLPQGSWNFKLLVDPSLVIITIYIVFFSVLFLGV